jgi:hypothetical protein
MITVQFLNVATLLVIVFCALDGLRQVQLFLHPWRATAFTMVCLGSFGELTLALQGVLPTLWAIALQLGYAIYAVRLMLMTKNFLRRATDVDHNPRRHAGYTR